MTDTTLERGEPFQKTNGAHSHWVRAHGRGHVLPGLVVTLGAGVHARDRRARAEQRATLEKLITERTGLAVRFDNVHFAWNLDGTSAVFTRVELTDPKAGRVRVVAPELRVELDTWDFLRHQQFSLGHVTLSSPDIEIIGDRRRLDDPRAARARQRSAGRGRGRRQDEARRCVRRYLPGPSSCPSAASRSKARACTCCAAGNAPRATASR